MKNTLFVLSLLLPTMLSAQTSAETPAVKEVINRLFTAMKSADSVLMKSCLDDEAVLQTIRNDEAKGNMVSNVAAARFISQVGNSKAGSLDERISFGSVLIDGSLAVVWTPYQFYYNGQFSHCGVNAFQLVKKAAGWKIISIIDTRRKEGCLPVGD